MYNKKAVIDKLTKELNSILDQVLIKANSISAGRTSRRKSIDAMLGTKHQDYLRGISPENADHFVQLWFQGLREKAKNDIHPESAANRIIKLIDDPLIRKYAELFLKLLYYRHYT